MAVQLWRQERCQRLSSSVESDEVGAAAAAREHASLSFSCDFQDVPIKMLPSPLEKWVLLQDTWIWICAKALMCVVWKKKLFRKGSVW